MKSQFGFTLVELLITLVVIAILATLSLGSNAYITQKNEQTRLVDDLKSAITYSKIQAQQLGKPVLLEPLDANQNWAQGLKLSTKNPKTRQKETLYQWQWYYPQWVLQWSGAHSTQQISFSNNPATAISNGTFQLNHVQANLSVVLVLNRLGRIRVAEEYAMLNPIKLS